MVKLVLWRIPTFHTFHTICVGAILNSTTWCKISPMWCRRNIYAIKIFWGLKWREIWCLGRDRINASHKPLEGGWRGVGLVKRPIVQRYRVRTHVLTTRYLLSGVERAGVSEYAGNAWRAHNFLVLKKVWRLRTTDRIVADLKRSKPLHLSLSY